MMEFAIHEVTIGSGVVALSPMPRETDDFDVVVAWLPTMVVSLTEPHEGDVSSLAYCAAEWFAIPVTDFGVPDTDVLDRAVRRAVTKIEKGGRVLFHCKGGCGRSGMAALRVMQLMQVPNPLAELRTARPCAVETQAQLDWALRPLAP